MRFQGIRLPLLAAVACASVGLSLVATDRSFGQAIYVYPTSTTIPLSTPYVYSRSYVVPTSYAFPRYIESSYTVDPAVSLLSTGYVETTYRRGLFGRRWIVERPVVASYATTYLPTSYVSAYVPTTYVSPTYYATSLRVAPTTYVSPTYYATSYRVAKYRPTAYTYYPSVRETAYVSSADICCDEVVADAPVVRSAAPASVASPAPSGGSREVESRSLDDPTIPSYVDAPLPADNTRARSNLRNDPTNRADADRADTPPNAPAATAEDDAAAKAAAKGQGGAGTGTPKTAPSQKPSETATPKKKAAAPDPDSSLDSLEPAPTGNEPFRRDSMKAVYPRLRAADRRNVLFGTVETDDGQARGEVPVSVVNRSNSALRHNGVSNAFGGFAIQVPDGQWRVRVTMPSGNQQTVRDITVANGRVLDNYENREVYNLIISY